MHSFAVLPEATSNLASFPMNLRLSSVGCGLPKMRAAQMACDACISLLEIEGERGRGLARFFIRQPLLSSNE